MKVLVTGGAGFLGGAVCAHLADAAHDVRSFNRSTSARLSELDIEQRRGDLRDAVAVSAAVAGMDAVVHCAAKTGIWGPASDFDEINVGGTRNVVDACRRHGVRRLVHTSSPSVVHAGTDLEGVDETIPLPSRHKAHYPRTKAIAERHVLAANSGDLATVALRPHLVWGPGDPHFLPRIIARAQAGRLRHLGPTGKIVDTVYVDNAAAAHVLAVAQLDVGTPITGRAYFITQGEPVALDVLINSWLAAHGLPAEHRRLPAWLARTAGIAVELAFRALRLRAEPPLTRFLVEQLTTAHWFDITAARRDLGYTPQIDTAEGLRRLALSAGGTG
ncbi:NAD-dependent epimerase/dehydratase family protein [Lentzea jiangxiensis]|uniref:Nucleoside-diphosphate-sugar epimerase n=1 Tax=Lentzea jiangxiensis TaxID=641025 RepID=A0A1H0X5X2_9PSEU|nr:NAD-dependent epimerase/dehydratase family protein [Lentzea jiangxiensis]SDP98135.1 Nucleoside-diphosphate-sugar epimerase [Lentzea jiangxiensis]